MYVWLDALMNYITALGYGTDDKNMDFWPARVHLIGKDTLTVSRNLLASVFNESRLTSP